MFKRRKYNNVKTEYNGRKYDSKREAEYAAELDLELEAGLITRWRPQVRLPLKGLKGEHVTTYIVDFEVIDHKGRRYYVEVKGYETDTWKIKWKLARQQYEEEFILIK